MGFKPVPTRKFKRWLKSKGLAHIRTQSSHEIWDYPDDYSGEPLLQPVVFRGAISEIPAFHIHTNLKTLGISKEQFEKEIAKM